MIVWQRSRRTASLLPNYIIATLLVLFSLLPLVTLASNSLKTTAEIGWNSLGLPSQPHWQNYVDAWEQARFSVTMRNSVILTFGTIAGVLVIAGMAAYALARLNVPGSDVLTLYLLVGTSMPAQLFMVPLFFMWNRLGLSNTLVGLIIIYWATRAPFATFLLRAYMVTIPRDFEDAARVDGASELQVLCHVIVPITWPGFLTVGLVTGLAVWNEFLFAVTFLHKPDLMPISTSLYAFQTRFSRDWGLTSAAAVYMALPVIVLFLLLQRQFIEGLTQGGLRA